MNLKEYQKMCDTTAKKDFESPATEVLTWGCGIAGEAGDVAGCIKKTFSHGSDDQKEGIRENLGDTMWYIAVICNFFKWNMEEVLEENIKKLKKRYPKGFFTSKDASRNNIRVDWGEK